MSPHSIPRKEPLVHHLAPLHGLHPNSPGAISLKNRILPPHLLLPLHHLLLLPRLLRRPLPLGVRRNPPG